VENDAPAGGGSALTLTTAHRSRGLQFRTVVLHGDMPYLLRSKAVSRPARSVFSPTAVAPTETPDFNELALFHVAVTRAERELHTNGLLAGFLESLPDPR